MRLFILAGLLLFVGCSGPVQEGQDMRELRRIVKQNELILKTLGGIVTTVAKLNDALNSLREDVIAERGQVAAALAHLASEIQRLQDIINQGTATPAEIQAAIDRIDAIRGEVAGIIRAAPSGLTATIEGTELVISFTPAEPGFETVIERNDSPTGGTFTDANLVPGDIPPRARFDLTSVAGTVRWRARHTIDGAAGPTSAEITTVDGVQQ